MNQNFSLTYANNLPIDQCKEYITKYFFPLSSSQHVFISYDKDGKSSYENPNYRKLLLNALLYLAN